MNQQQEKLAALYAVSSQLGSSLDLTEVLNQVMDAIIQDLYPRATYWDVFAAQTAAITIHFADEPTLRDFTCPEGSHMDQSDAVRFTRSLVVIMKACLAARRAQ